MTNKIKRMSFIRERNLAEDCMMILNKKMRTASTEESLESKMKNNMRRVAVLAPSKEVKHKNQIKISHRIF